jgi:FKBP-type peptidyl-prolyl cis-trans isomerase
MKKAPWKTLMVLALASSTVLGLSACENKNAATGANGSNTAGTASVNSSGASSASARKLSGIQVEDVREGTGREAKRGDTVSVNYLGTLANNGKKFDSSYDRNEPFTFKLGSGQVIEGWEQGIVGMKVGGKRILVIPPDKAYGDQEVGGVIPANSTLKFEVELMDVN